ncbi:uncharacterized protein EV154DRAFT_554728 [Mucor mucedo]|uniref:uncharacterized protein n=1 Tax=Mucor mucedo TaxID=29922 RepID=UPI002220A968|nr:uncharacterized protein EV154DRAFT_554728 [Mucor mucedo]KAI7885944.1 hypothetical protein EV154DRAFT_554728 [Mucor mucedo]
MKDGFKSIEIEPTEGYLDFIGPAKFDNTNEPARVLKGEVRFTLTKPVKIRNMSVKFKGFSHITLHQPTNIEMTSPLLPKLKLPIFGRTTLPAGDHVIPWEMDIPNIYPRSLLVKRATINYKVIVSISTGITRTLTAEYPIVLRRHLLPYKELAPIIETKLFQRTVPGKFHYEIDAPQIVCIEQEHIPIAIKYISFANQKTVQSIRTRLVQIELYRRQSLSKSDSDLSYSNRDSQIFDLDQKMADASHYKDTHVKFIKRTVPALIHIPDSTTSAWKRPCLVRHRLHPYLSYTLDSPLVSIYHQIEVTFQFGMKYEEIKAKIPIIVASIPKRESSASSAPADDMMMKYAFEEVARSEFLPYRLESRSAPQNITDDDLTTQNNDSYSVIRDNNIMPEVSDDEEGNITGRVTPMMFVNEMKTTTPTPYMVSNNNHSCQYDIATGGRRALSPTPETGSSYLKQEEHRQLKKFASALDLSTVSQELSYKPDAIYPEERPRTTTPTMRRQPMYRNALQPPNFELGIMSQEELYKPDEADPEERPRTTTPTMRRQVMHRKALPPLNIDLANRKERGPLPPPPVNLPLPLPPQPAKNKIINDSGSSDVLPAVDRAVINSRNDNSHNNTTNNRKNKQWSGYDDSNDDLRSIYSDSSMTSANAPSLSSSATLSTNKSYPTLHSRPPSPVFSPAPGLPATIALRHQEIQASQVEETFPDSATAMSPAMNTVASSAVLSPRTSYALHRRIALSTISSLTNDSLQLGPSLVSRGRSSSTVDPDIQSLMMMSRYSDNSYDSTPPNRYINARLPPIPTSTTIPPKKDPSRRLTKIYTDDSDDEIVEEEPFPEHLQGTSSKLQGSSSQLQGSSSQLQGPSSHVQGPSSHLQGSSNNTVNDIIQDDCPPPRLPRLSFGGDFGISLGI